MPDQKQIEKMYEAAKRRLGHAELLDSEENGFQIALYLKQNGLPMNEETLYRAIVACKDVLKWKVAPKKKIGEVQAEKDTGRKNHAAKEDETWGQGPSIMRDAVTKADHVKATNELRSLRSTISAHCGRTHAATYRQRGELEKTLNNLLKQFPEPTLTLKQAEFIKSQINVVRNGFPE
jgi:hypothetical protein